MNSRCVPFAVLALATLAPAQEPPKPAAELQQLAAFVGNWQGEGTMTEPGNVVTKWKGIGTYQWALDGHFVREDFRIEFEGMPVPVVMHGYLGWDREQQRFVHLHVSSAGEAALHTMAVAGGAATSFSLHEQGGMAYSQRMVFAVKGDTLSHTVELLLPQGPSLAMVAGSFRRGGDGFAGNFDSPAFNGAVPHADLARLTKSAGVYQTQGQMVMAPGMPPRMPAMMIIDAPLPMPCLSICSPSHIRNMQPAVRAVTAMTHQTTFSRHVWRIRPCCER